MPKETLPKDSLAFALLKAAKASEHVLKGQSLPDALAEIFSKEELSSQVMGAIQSIAYRTMRNLGMAQFLLKKLTFKLPNDSFLRAFFYVAFSLLLKQNDTRAYEPFTLVNQSVLAAKSIPSLFHQQKLVNAILRRFLREEKSLLEIAQKDPVARWNYPLWWIQKLKKSYPQKWEQILTIGNSNPPLTLRVNTRKIAVSDYLKKLSERDIAFQQVGPVAIQLKKALPVHQIIGFQEGWVSVQDAAAQKVVELLDLKPQMRILDACAAPGGKTALLLEQMDLNLTALDVSKERLQRVFENLDRLGLSARVIQGDAREKTWWDQEYFDCIIVDAPCTASGILRRHPDIRWLRRESDIQQLTTLSAQILDNLWQLLRPNGKLLFITCSIWPEESEKQAKRFEKKHLAKRLSALGQLLPTDTQTDNHDGLFYALFQKVNDETS